MTTQTQELDYQKLASALLAAQLAQNGGRQKAVSSTPTTVYGHGVTGPQPGGVAGLFSYPGLEPDLVNAMVMPRLCTERARGVARCSAVDGPST